MRSCWGRLFRSYYIRLRMCAATASIDRIVLHASLTNWMWDSRNRFVSSWQFRCFLGLITSKSAAIAFTGLSTQTSSGKLNLDHLLAYGRKINRQILNPERNLRIKRERMEVSLQFAKLAKVIYIAGGDFCIYYWRSHRSNLKMIIFLLILDEGSLIWLLFTTIWCKNQVLIK